MEPADFADEARRLVARLRSLPDVRLARELTPGCSAAAAGHAVAQRLVDLAAGLEQAGDAPVLRQIPPVPDFAVGDVVAVTAQDLVSATGSPASARTESAATALAEGAAACRALRLTL